MRKNLTYLLILLAVLLAGFLSVPNVRADWVGGIFSERAGIDSLNRFLVIRDTEKEKLFGNKVLSLGDINGDNISDLLICRSERTTIEVSPTFLFYRGSPPDDVFDRQFDGFLTTIDIIGDVNSDGFLDFGGRQYPPIRWELHFGGLNFDDSAEFTFPEMFSGTAPAADFDADGTLELALSRSVNGGFVNIYRLDSLLDTIPEYVIPDTAVNFGHNLAVGDFNGDSYPDLAVAASYNRPDPFVKFYWGGPGFDTVPDFEIRTNFAKFGTLMVPLGDFNGDGYGDIFIGGNAAEPYGIYWGGPNIDDHVDLIVNSRGGSAYFGPSSADLAGDFNNDGYPDLIIGDDLMESIRVFLGGPTTDTISYGDIYTDTWIIPGPQNDFGKTVFGVGDFNGDGIDDIAVNSRSASYVGWYGEVNFFAGYDLTPTDVPYEYEPTLPVDFRLSQNHPNPFNPSTTIEFDLPRRSMVILTVFNVLGQKVAGLLDNELAAGSYSIEWDGQSDGGVELATGVYFYRLTTDDFSATEKMLLLK